ncbi:MAG: 4Fe-4S binding protein [Lachnospiraceae bacterium]|nr:4Fe-4S binding protein [Lachnospiraceae bacterium]
MADNTRRRICIEGIAALIQNANFKGFFTGKIYEGPGKNVCVPGLNCYSCPGAVGSCPIGSLQGFLSKLKFRFPYYILGLLIFFGALLGRVVCGFLCPFGLLQELINLIPFPVKRNRFKADRPLRFLKYVILIVFVIILPICIKLTPFFCKYICPSGTVSGILLSISNSAVASKLGKIFTWKLIVLLCVLISSLIIFRPFCKYICPLGAIYGLFNRFSLVKMECDKSKCIECGKCAAACKMCVDPSKSPNSTECIRCGDCIKTCPVNALKKTVKI